MVLVLSLSWTKERDLVVGESISERWLSLRFRYVDEFVREVLDAAFTTKISSEDELLEYKVLSLEKVWIGLEVNKKKSLK